MLFLEFLYALALSTQKTLARPAPRSIPLLGLSMFSVGPVYAGVMGLAELWSPGAKAVLSQTNGWRGMDWAYTLAIAITVIFAWLWFDRRRVEIDAKFAWIRPCATAVCRLFVGALLMGSGMTLLTLGVGHPLLSILVYALTLIVGSMFVRGVTKI